MTRRPRPSRHRLVQHVQLGLLATLVLLILLYNVSFTRHNTATTTTTTLVARENLERFRQRHPREDTLLRIQQHDTTTRGRLPRPNGFTTSVHIKKPPPRQYAAHDFANCTLLRPDDSIYRYGDDWDGAPIVVEAYRLLFFTVPKVGCTVWKQCFRRVAGYDDWREDRHPLPHAPARNGLTYLYDLPPTVAETVMTAPDWTRAIFVRDPRERLLSAYLDKGRDNRYLQHHCCSTTATRRGESEVNNTLDRLLHCHDDDDDNGVLAQRDKEPLVSFEGFIKHVVPMCEDKHWKPQADRLEEKFWPYINFVGHYETMAADAQRLLRRIGAWEEYGAYGWPGAVFAGDATVRHATHAGDRMAHYYTTTAIEVAAEAWVHRDYELSVLQLMPRRKTVNE